MSGCDGCGIGGLPLSKVSLARDFFGGVYDRLTPASDKSPAWYCPTCSAEKRMQTDYRLIAAAWADYRAGRPSPLNALASRKRACLWLRETARRLGGGGAQRLLTEAQVTELYKQIEAAERP